VKKYPQAIHIKNMQRSFATLENLKYQKVPNNTISVPNLPGFLLHK